MKAKLDHTNYRVDPDGSSIAPTPEDTKARPARDGEIPIVDLRMLCSEGPDKAIAAGVLAEACERVGFFYVVSHAVPDSVIKDAFRYSKLFFDQSNDIKQALAVDACQRGYRRNGTIAIPGNPPDQKEVFELGVDLPMDHPKVRAGKSMHGPNQWPDLPGFRAAMEAYFVAGTALGQALLPGFALGLGLSEDYFAPFHRDPAILWRLMRYPPTSAHPEQFGTAPHTDFGTLTLLIQDDQGGLEVRLQSGEWIEAPYIPGSFVVNIGDLMAFWTNDRFTSTAHRVTNRSETDRYSIPMFFNPDFDTVVECLPECATHENPPQYKPIHYGTYVETLTDQIFMDPPIGT
jgi:isopenicillin N synthase-like dioxygenase